MKISCTPIPVLERSAAHKPCARSSHAACAVDDRWVIVHGGWTGLKPLSCCWALNLETFSWNQIKAAGEQPSARQGHSISFFPKTRKLLLFGGLDASGAVVKDKAYFLTVPADITDRWHWQVGEVETSHECVLNCSPSACSLCWSITHNRRDHG